MFDRIKTFLFEYGKYLLRNNYEIRKSIYLRLKEVYKVKLTDFKFADLELDENNYIVMMPLINMEKLARLYYYLDINENHKNIHIFGLEEYENTIKTFLPKCNYKSMSRGKIEELLEEYADKEDETI